MELELIDFLAQMVNDQKAREQGYVASTRWLCTREDLKEECKKEALKIFEDWKKDEFMAKESRDALNAQINNVGL